MSQIVRTYHYGYTIFQHLGQAACIVYDRSDKYLGSYDNEAAAHAAIEGVAK